VVGEHVGLMFYTLGQRKGLNIGGAKDGNGEPWFVAGKDMAANRLVVVQGHDHPLLLKPTLQMADLSWTLPQAPAAGDYAAKNRYRMADAACTLSPVVDGKATLTFRDKQWAVTPGQSAVLYDGDICLGGGIIQ
jgi:tRNA-specific 2-thiouridylase